MISLIANHWWVFLLRGVFAIIFGVLALTMPGVTLASLVLLWGIYALSDGLIALFVALFGKSVDENRWLIGLQGVIGVLAGFLTLLYPAATGLALLLFIAAWSIAVGALQIAAAIQLRKEIKGEFWMILSGVISILFAFLVIARPGEGALALLFIIAFYAFLFGALMIAFSLRLRGMKTATPVAKA